MTHGELITAMWGDAGDCELKLRALLHRLRVAAGKDGPELRDCVVTGRGTYCWNAEMDAEIDVVEFEALAARVTAAQEETRQEKTQQTEAQQAENRQEETGQTETAAAQTMDPQAFEIISRDFSHSGYVDSIAFLLPSGWAYESYERMHAGEGMDPEEWGFEIRMDGKEEPVLLVYGSRQEGEGRFDPENESSQEVQTGAGLTGQRYTRQTVAEDGGIRQEYYVRFDSVAGSGAVYQVYASLSPEDYEKYRTSLDTLTAGISIAAIARTE